MASLTTEFFSNIENQYSIWVQSKEKTKEVTVLLENIDITIIFNRGCWIYPVPNCPTPARIENTINVVSSNNDEIKNLFNEHFNFHDEDYKCSVRFFSSESLVKKKLAAEEKAYASKTSPKYGIEHECALL